MSTGTNVKAIVREFIVSRTQAGDFGDDVDLFESGLVNSLFAIELMTFLEKKFSVKIGMDDLDRRNFQSLDAVAGFLSSKGVA